MSELMPLEDPEGHRWVRPRSEECPDCPCCRAFVCERREWQLFPSPETRPGVPCPCEWAYREETAR